MKKTTLKTRLWALAATLLLLVSLLAMPVSAAINTTASNGKITFQKHLVMDKEANVPNVTFEFKIAPGDPASYENQGKANTAVYAGIMGENPPVIYAGNTKPDSEYYGKVTFAAGDDTTDIAPVEPEAAVTQKEATKNLTVDFTGVDFTAPGIYRYVITEKNGGSSGITYDTSRTLDVYVQYKKNTVTGEGQPEYTDELEVAYYVLQDGTAVNPDTATTNGDNATKSDGFTNTYTTYDLTLTKKVTGNQGDRDKYFAFTVNITGAVAGTVYTVDLPETDNHEDNSTDPLIVGEGGSVSATYYLKHGQSIVIQGLTANTHYTIEEKSYSTDGYSTAYSVEVGGEKVVKSTNSTGDRKMSIDKPDGTAITDDNVVTFTNSKSGTVPTGILLETAPYLILGAVVVAGLVVLFATRRRRTRE